MIMRVGGRFPYLHEPESVFAAQWKGRGRCSNACVSSLNFSVHVRAQAKGVEISDGAIEA